MNRPQRLLAALAVGGLALSILTLTVPEARAQLSIGPESPSVQKRSARLAFDEGRLAEARVLARSHDDADSLLVRARFARWEGDDAGARTMAARAFERAPDEPARARAGAALANLQWFAGDWDDAEALLRSLLAEQPQSMEVRFALGRMLWDRGARPEARQVLEAMAARYNDGLIEDPADLVYVARAMRLIGRLRDANRALGRAARQAPERPDVHLAFAELMLAGYNNAEAEDSLERVLELAPQHPDAHRLMAKIAFFVGGDIPGAEASLQSGRELAPHHPELILLEAELALTLGQWAQTRDLVSQLLTRAPRHAEALGLLAASAYLAGDENAFAEARKAYEGPRAELPDLDVQVAQGAAQNNRHDEAVAFFEQALARDAEHPAALAGLGLALTRTGDEARALTVLREAARQDPFHVRVHNMVQLYESGLRDYVTETLDGGLRLRAHLDQHRPLSAASLPVVEEAHALFSQRYGVQIEPLMLEIYPEPQTFSVRSVGVPQIDPHGICFGDTVLMRSPSDANFNWELVLWHEIAHAYHIRVSQGRVPRWFTEGLAEYETAERDPAYRRFHDDEIARRLQHGGVPALSELGDAFLTGRGGDVVVTYQLASLAVEYIVEIGGREAIDEILRAFAQTPLFEEVAPRVLDMSGAALDQDFDRWLRRRFSALLAQPVVDWGRLGTLARGGDLTELSAAEEDAYHALLAAMQGRADQAQVLIRAARRQAEASGDAGERARVEAILAHALAGLELDEEALQAGWRALDQGLESAELRMALARSAAQREALVEAAVHAEAATSLNPYSAAAWALLEERAGALDDAATVRLARRARFELDPHDPKLAQVIAETADGELQLRAARRRVAIEALSADAHLALARLLAERGKPELARRAYESAALSDPARASTIDQESQRRLTRGMSPR
ncbi:hypothetical protein DL240_12365 [Lujinxingia litoralis]|uniref:Tetratricopeptide repeat protein n=1 Tax=Lujinxingia litoralis TaxID=2211119 RepID=A0A328C3N4_9DELT|nr:tetratricopeptide repeat protein [Lujinxingia litoralis]RAL21644.1 hypothetical protein DL240_12365 [Lujinxingia litoralis]